MAALPFVIQSNRGMIMSKRILLGFALVLASVSAFAGSADVCYSAYEIGTATPLTASTPLKCPIAGNHSLVELAKAEWSIVSVTSVMGSLKPGDTGPTMAWMVVIQKPKP